MKAYITKYALTKGIFEAEGKTCEDSGSPDMLSVGSGTYYHGEGKEWHRTREGAVCRAWQMQSNKIASLRKQTRKLEGMKFI